MRPLQITIGLNVLEHLGMNLYSNVPAVLSEIVANAWDADARTVKVELCPENSEIVIEDDGSGMTRDEVIDRFLFVGFKRRDSLGARTPRFGRLPMGRKGIGKLSSFSIADVVTVFSIRDGECTGGRMDVKTIRKALEENPREQAIEVFEVPDNQWPDNFSKGTRIILSDLRKRLTSMTSIGLRQRIARRFSVIGPSNEFQVFVNRVEVTPSDRMYLQHVEYLWVYGEHDDIVNSCKNLHEGRPPVVRSNFLSEEHGSPLIKGWIGTVKHPNFLKGDNQEKLNRLAIFMRGKLCHEDILNDLEIKELYANYLVGEIHCNELDRDEEVDMATSSRQALKRDDPRFEAILKNLKKELRYISNTWSEWRREDGSKILVKEVPAIQKWLDSLEGDVRKKATRWIGKLNNIQVDHSKDLIELLKASVLTFEIYARRMQLDFLDGLTDESIEPILKVFNDIDSLELSYYGQIVKFRVDVIRKLESLIAENVKEHQLRDYLYEHLWLLDPSWERAKTTETVEKTIRKFLEDDTKSLTPEERHARIDIGYQRIVGAHVIVELKRAEVVVKVVDLVKQITKYRTGAQKILRKSNHPTWPLEIIVLLGRPPREFESSVEAEVAQNLLDAVNARIVYYDQLLSSALSAYQDYLEKHKKVDRLFRIFEEIDDFSMTHT
ncbi:MAG: ATP-binding protein [Gammaproteobacteria bacterium]|nr:ATP-binding protein [Gammaproteobacteria bacterium]